MDSKSQLLALLNHVHSDERAFVAGLTEADRAASGTPENWSAKDLIAHIAEWRARLAQRLTAVQHGDPLPELRTVDEYNAAGFEANRYKTWAEVDAESERAYADTVVHITRLSGEELDNPKPRPIPWYRERPLRGSILVNSYLHPVTHLVEFYQKRGDTARARQIIQGATQDLRALDPSDAGRGLAMYNLACLCAGMGEPAQAIELLRGVLPYHPDLKDWSKQDEDFAAVRDLPEFQALYAE